MTIACQQLTYALNEVLTGLLREYRRQAIPGVPGATARVLTLPPYEEVMQRVRARVPTPGAPLSRYLAPPLGPSREVIDAEQYNQVWRDLLADFRILYLTIYDQTQDVLRGMLQTTTVSTQLDREMSRLGRRLQSLTTTKQIGAIFSGDFSTLDQVSYAVGSAGTPETDAQLDLNEKCAELPALQSEVVKQDLTEAQLGYALATQGTAIQIAGAEIANLLDDNLDTCWLLQVDGDGGGAVVDVVLTLPDAISANAVYLRPLNYATYHVFQTVAGTETEVFSRTTADALTAETPSQAASSFRIRIERQTGSPTEGAYRYFLGLRELSLLLTRHADTAQVISPVFTVPEHLLEQGIGAVRLHADQSVPAGCQIEHSLDYGLGWQTLPADSVEWTALENRQRIAADLIAFTAASTDTVNGRPLYTSLHGLAKAIPSSLYADDAGVYITNMWRVRSFECAWPWDTGHAPGPQDWTLLPPGVTSQDIASVFVAVPEGTVTRIHGLTSELRAGRNYLWETSVFFNTAPGPITVTTADPDSYESSTHTLANLETNAALLDTGGNRTIFAQVYVNGAPITKFRASTDGTESDLAFVYSFQQGWNRVSVYVRTTDTYVAGAVSNLALGVKLYPQEKTQLLSPDGAYSCLPPTASVTYLPSEDVSATGWTKPEGATSYFSVVAQSPIDLDDFVAAAGNPALGENDTLVMAMTTTPPGTGSLSRMQFHLVGKSQARTNYAGHCHLWYSLDEGATWLTLNNPARYISATVPDQAGSRSHGVRHSDEGRVVQFSTKATEDRSLSHATVELPGLAFSALDQLYVKLVHDHHASPQQQGAVTIFQVQVQVDYAEANPSEPAGNPLIDFCRARRSSLELVSNFDLGYNTPPLYPWRCALLTQREQVPGGAPQQVTHLRVSFNPDHQARLGLSGLNTANDQGDALRFRVYATVRSTDAPTPYTWLRHRAVLSTAQDHEGVTPKLYSYRLEVV